MTLSLNQSLHCLRLPPPLHAGDGRAVPLACTVSQQPRNSPTVEMFPFPWLGTALQLRWDTPVCDQKNVLKERRSSNVVYTSIKKCSVWARVYAEGWSPPQAACRSLAAGSTFQKRGATFLLFAEPAGHSS